MKYLRLIDHNGIERHVFQVFVEGQDFEYEFLEPVALWFGKLELVDKLLEPEPREVEEIIEETKETIVRIEEVQFEPETAITAGNGDTGATSSDTFESAKVTPEISDSGAASKGSKRDKGAKKS
uniref:Uncharacterized protein n=1 Tax=viral metagenome TaxID=1070528 RepID=A0A6H1ZYC8_9ZZZZ